LRRLPVCSAVRDSPSSELGDAGRRYIYAPAVPPGLKVAAARSTSNCLGRAAQPFGCLLDREPSRSNFVSQISQGGVNDHGDAARCVIVERLEYLLDRSG
jgi:hypothetical protein